MIRVTNTMLGILCVLFSTANFNDKAIDLLTSAANDKAILTFAKYSHDSEFSRVVAKSNDLASFDYAISNQVRPQPNTEWICDSLSSRDTLKKGIVSKLIASGGTYDVATIYFLGTDNRSTDPRTNKVWKEVINLYRRIEGHRSNFTVIGITIDYQLGVISSGHSVFSNKPVHLKPGLTEAVIQREVEHNGVPDEVKRQTIWFPYNVFYPFNKSGLHSRELYLATIVTAKHKDKWTTYLFDESGNVQVNPVGLMVF